MILIGRVGVLVAGGAAASLLAVAAAPAPAPVSSVAAAARPTVTCDVDNKGATKPFVRPTNCIVLGQDPFAEGVNLRRLKWRGWGSSRATAKGIECGFKSPCARISVRVTAYGLTTEECENGDTARGYSKLRVTSKYGTSRVIAPACSTAQQED